MASIYLTYHLKNKKSDFGWFLVFGDYLSGISKWIRENPNRNFIVVTNTTNRIIVERSHIPVIAYHIKQHISEQQMVQCLSQIKHNLYIEDHILTTHSDDHWQCWSNNSNFRQQWGLFNYYDRTKPAIIVMDSQKASELALHHSSKVRLNIIWKFDSILPQNNFRRSISINHYFEDIENSSKVITRLYQIGVPLINIHSDNDAIISNLCSSASEIRLAKSDPNIVYLSTKAKKQLCNKISMFKLGKNQKFLVSDPMMMHSVLSTTKARPTVAILLSTEVASIQKFHQVEVPVLIIDKYSKVKRSVKQAYDSSWLCSKLPLPFCRDKTI